MSDSKSLVTRIAARFGVESNKFYETLKTTAFKQRDGSAPTNEQMMTLLIVAEQYKLNPFTREIYAFPDKNNGIIPVVGVDGWSRIINEHPHYDGIEFVYSDKMLKMKGAKVESPEWIETVIYRKDRARPIKIREYLDEVYREPFQGKSRNGSYAVEGPWQTHTKRQLRHKSFIQCSRMAFGFVGIYDQDEAERIREMGQASVIDLPNMNQNSSQQIVKIDHKKLDPFLQRLVSRAIKQNAWSAAHQYIAERFQGSELVYATQFLRDEELDAMEPLKLSDDEQEAEVESSNTDISADNSSSVSEEQSFAEEDDFFGDKNS